MAALRSRCGQYIFTLWFLLLILLWPPYVIGQAIYIFILWFLMAALWNRRGKEDRRKKLLFAFALHCKRCYAENRCELMQCERSLNSLYCNTSI